MNVAIKTPVGKTDRRTITNAIIQGDVFGPMFCAKQIDEIGKECLENEKYTYSYKGEVAIPPLVMLDDVAYVAECGPNSVMSNTYISFKTNSKKLQFGAGKCAKMHIGKSWEPHKCIPLYVENWVEREMESDRECKICGDTLNGKNQVEHPVENHRTKEGNDCQKCDDKVPGNCDMKKHEKENFKCKQCENSFGIEVKLEDHKKIHKSESIKIRLTDDFAGEEEMESKKDERYLGDIIATDGRNIKNIEARVKKGIGIVKNILDMLEGIPFGKFYYEVAVILRNSLLVSSILFNSEAWYNLTQAELNLIETVDIDFLRGVLKAPRSTPKEMFFLELGILPLREIIRKRRLGFLHYILQQKNDSIVYKVFEIQSRNPTSKDWVTTVLNDLEEINMEMKFEDIKKMERKLFMNIVKRKIEYKTLNDLNRMKANHSKVMHIEHNTLKMQKYLMPNEANLRIEESQLIFKLRCRTTNVKMNMKSSYESYACRACGNENESQNHVINCKILLEMNKESEKIIEYEKIFSNCVMEQKLICKQFSRNMKKLEEWKT